jgi:putative endonuclease
MNLGRYGEDLALKFLEAKGYALVFRNFRFQRAEIDLIVKNDSEKLLVFTEVKTRRSRKFGMPEEGITRTKTEQIYKSAEGFLFQNPVYTDYIKRFDIVAIMMEGDKEKINHIENAF